MLQYGVFAVRVLLGRAPCLSRLVITTAQLDKGQICLSGYIFSTYTPQIGVITIRKFRDETVTRDFDLTITAPNRPSLGRKLLGWFGLRWDLFSVCLDFPWDSLPASIYGMGFRTDQTTSSPRLLPEAAQILTDDAAHRTYCLFTEPSVNVARIEMYHFGSDVVQALAAQSTSDRPEKIGCVIGEYTNTARDNGRALFEWLQAHSPDIEAHYVIEDVNFDAYATHQTNVVTFGSAAHLAHCLDAHVCAFTHHRSYVYPYILNMIAPRRYRATRTLFLQHGIIAMKKSIARHYHYDRVGYDAFCVSSQNEKDIITQYFGYPEQNVRTTGLPRFDQLLHKATAATPNPDQILVFPTWRPGLEKETSDHIADLAFIRQWQEALAKLQTTQLRICLILHPMLARHATLFAPYVDDMQDIRFFQETLTTSAALVTDYSSVSFDALLLKKPVFLFQFDQHESGLAQDAFIDIATQLPGQVSLRSDTLLAQVADARAGQWPFTHHAQRDLYFDACDTQNAARLSEVVKQLGSAS